MFYNLNDLPEEIQEIVRMPCSVCNVVGIHDCRYNEDLVKEKLKEDLKNKQTEEPDSVDKNYSRTIKKKKATNNKPVLSDQCLGCHKKTQAVNGLCYNCTVKNREKPKPKWEYIKDKMGRIKGKRFISD